MHEWRGSTVIASEKNIIELILEILKISLSSENKVQATHWTKHD